MLDRMCLLQETSFASFWTDFLAIVSGRAENLGEGLEAQVMKVDNPQKIYSFTLTWTNIKSLL